MQRAIDRIVARAIRCGLRSLRGNREPWAREWRRWARAWLNGSDRSEAAAAEAWSAAAWSAAAWAAWAAASAARAEEAAAEAAAAAAAAAEAAAERAAASVAERAAARAAELRLQARDIRREIPEWPCPVVASPPGGEV
jgi:hypothetical protein